MTMNDSKLREMARKLLVGALERDNEEVVEDVAAALSRLAAEKDAEMADLLDAITDARSGHGHDCECQICLVLGEAREKFRASLPAPAESEGCLNCQRAAKIMTEGMSKINELIRSEPAPAEKGEKEKEVMIKAVLELPAVIEQTSSEWHNFCEAKSKLKQALSGRE